MRQGKTWAVLVSVLALAGCRDGQGPGDAGPERLPLDEPLGLGQVRAGQVIQASELLSGPEAHGRIGDFKLYNEQVAFLVEGLEPHGWAPYGGGLLDAERLGPGGATGGEAVQALVIQIDMLSMKPDSIEVLQDGADGSAAAVRVRGRQQSIPTLDAALGGLLRPEDLEIVHDYVLEPDADHLLIRTAIRTRAVRPTSLQVGELVLHGDSHAGFVPGAIAAEACMPAGKHRLWAGYSRRDCNLYANNEGSALINSFSLHEASLITAGQGEAPTVASGEPPLEVERMLLLGRGGLDDCLRRYRALVPSGEATGLIAGAVQEGGAPAAGVELRAHDLGRPSQADLADQCWTDAQGRFELELPAGRYRLELLAHMRTAVLDEPVQLDAGGRVERALSVESPARLAFACTNGAGAALPCKLSLQAGHAAAMSAPVRTDAIAFAPCGQAEIVAPAGEWTATLSRGFEYGIARRDVSLQAGGTVRIEGRLARQVDSRGYIAADLHTHCTRSIDSSFDVEDKLASNICEGIELVVATDHDGQTDYRPTLERIALACGADPDALIHVEVGNELSALIGHTTAVPLQVHPAGWHYWDFPYWRYDDRGVFERQLELPELWAAARASGARIINLAHPLSYTAWFDYLGLDPREGMPPVESLPADKFSTDFDIIELLNKKDVQLMIDEVLPMWCGLNNQGVFRTAVGNSDSHSRLEEAGFGRTLIASSSDEPAGIDADAIWEALAAGQATIFGGIFVQLSAGEVPMGGLVTGPGPLALCVRVEAADWIPVDELVLIANGEEIEHLGLFGPGELDPERPALRLEQALELAPERDTWYAALALSPPGSSLDPVCRACRPVGLANPIRFDADGNGRFDPPQ
ncbi:MAG: CehA/McbA family metallohydrolase [Deltaproteobacteria bacterium]|nr:CehA/McbA family metallohydrolase [Deltaproteobacteria bacterium]